MSHWAVAPVACLLPPSHWSCQGDTPQSLRRGEGGFCLLSSYFSHLKISHTALAARSLLAVRSLFLNCFPPHCNHRPFPSMDQMPIHQAKTVAIASGLSSPSRSPTEPPFLQHLLGPLNPEQVCVWNMGEWTGLNHCSWERTDLNCILPSVGWSVQIPPRLGKHAKSPSQWESLGT